MQEADEKKPGPGMGYVAAKPTLNNTLPSKTTLTYSYM